MYIPLEAISVVVLPPPEMTNVSLEEDGGGALNVELSSGCSILNVEAFSDSLSNCSTLNVALSSTVTGSLGRSILNVSPGCLTLNPEPSSKSPPCPLVESHGCLTPNMEPGCSILNVSPPEVTGSLPGCWLSTMNVSEASSAQMFGSFSFEYALSSSRGLQSTGWRLGEWMSV